MPYFSIILPTYNRAHLLPKAIESVLAQTFTDWELVIVDDGSTDNTKDLVATFKDQRIRYIYQENQERSAARNNGIKQSRGAYICFLDSDDYFLEKKLENFSTYIHSFISKPLVIYDNISIEEQGKITKFELPDQSNYESTFEFLMFNSLYSQQMCIDKSVLKVFQYNCSLNNNEDTELWLRISHKNNFNHLSSSYQTVIVEHNNRSINLLNDVQISEVIKLYNLIFEQSKNSIKVNTKTKKKIFGGLYFKIAKIKMQQSKKLKAMIWLLRSLLINPRGEINKHLIYCLKNLIIGKIPKQYQLKQD